MIYFAKNDAFFTKTNTFALIKVQNSIEMILSNLKNRS